MFFFFSICFEILCVPDAIGFYVVEQMLLPIDLECPKTFVVVTISPSVKYVLNFFGEFGWQKWQIMVIICSLRFFFGRKKINAPVIGNDESETLIDLIDLYSS